MNDNGKKGFFTNLWALIVTYVKAVWIDLVKLRSYLTEPAKRRQVLSDFWDFLKRWFRLIIRERVMR
ncbi:MAG TPA: hypothetical protein PLL58_06845, partial [Candidatus Syntrophosphaera sp.]|nr:hypothetical protein [Candidatus Syntrophosphaera sp.]